MTMIMRRHKTFSIYILKDYTHGHAHYAKKPIFVQKVDFLKILPTPICRNSVTLMAQLG